MVKVADSHLAGRLRAEIQFFPSTQEVDCEIKVSGVCSNVWKNLNLNVHRTFLSVKRKNGGIVNKDIVGSGLGTSVNHFVSYGSLDRIDRCYSDWDCNGPDGLVDGHRGLVYGDESIRIIEHWGLVQVTR